MTCTKGTPYWNRIWKQTSRKLVRQTESWQILKTNFMEKLPKTNKLLELLVMQNNSWKLVSWRDSQDFIRSRTYQEFLRFEAPRKFTLPDVRCSMKRKCTSGKRMCLCTFHQESTRSSRIIRSTSRIGSSRNQKSCGFEMFGKVGGGLAFSQIDQEHYSNLPGSAK